MQPSAVAVLDALRPAGPLTAGEVMEVTGLSRPTVHAACEELIRLGWAVEREGRPTDEPRTGRPARVYEFHARAGYALGVDMGVHTVRALVTDLRGDVVGEARSRFRSPRIGAAERLDGARSVAREALARAGVEPTAVLAVALGVPAAVDGLTGHARASEEYLPGLAAVDLRETFAGTVERRALVENDANLAALAERWRGAAAGADDVVVLLAGERLGAGLVLGGSLVRGRHGGAGEMGFLDLIPGLAATGIATWARVLGARALAARAGGARAGGARAGGARALAARAGGARAGGARAVGGGAGFDTSVPSAAEIASDGPSAEEVLAAARAGEAWAREVVDVVADKLATALAPVVTLLDPGLVVISGAVAASCDVLLPGIEARLAELAPWPARLAASDLGDRVVVTGAVRLALDAIQADLRG